MAEKKARMKYINNNLESKQVLRKVFLTFIVWKGLFYLLTLLTLSFSIMNTSKIVTKGFFFHFFPENHWLDSFFRWDSGWYLGIITEGYYFNPGQQSSVAFFPLYPLLVKAVSTVTSLHPAVAGLLVSNICLIFALFFTYKIASIYLQEDLCEKVLILILTFPVSFFFSSLYTESLYFLTISASFYFFLKERYLSAGIWGFLASLTRLTGILLIIAFSLDLLLKYWKYKKFKKSILSLLLIPGGLVSYMCFLSLKFGNPWAFYEVQKAWGRNQSTSFFNSLWQGLSKVNFIFQKDATSAITFLNCLIPILAILILVFYWKKSDLNSALITFSILSILIPLSTGNTDSMMRYLLPVFPLFILLGYISKKDSVYMAIVFTFTYLQSAIFLWFANWGWVT